MKFLLDTHAFIWNDGDPKRLTMIAADLIADGQNTILLSYASIWEMQIKLALGKLTFSRPLHEIVQAQTRKNNFELLSIQLTHTWTLDQLPAHHRDPFDRSSHHGRAADPFA